MCLHATSERDNGNKPPPDTVAWKVVLRRTRRPYWRIGAAPYKRGSKHFASPKKIRAGRDQFGRYYFGLHVFTTLESARTFLVCYAAERTCLVIRVRVRPRDWMASEGTEAVYSRLEVLT